MITYRSVLLLYNPETTPASIKQRIAYVVAHELAHQWFGNLVTMYDFEALYLNEAFATYVGWAATHEFFPDWKVWEQYVVNDFQRALELDALVNSHPIEVEITNPNKADEVFDAISYCKGSSVLRMLVEFVGEEDFRTGMRAYVAKYKYANTVSVNLWDSLSEGSGKNVSQMMDAWVSQMGYPVVTTERVSDTRVKVTQSRFLSAGPGAVTGAPDKWWKIPLRVVTGDAPSDVKHILMEDETMEFDVPAGTWVKLNEGRIGFYRVLYDDASAALLSTPEALATLSASDRVGLVNDAFALASAGYGSTTTALDLIAAVGASETEYIVWADISSSIGEVGKGWGTHDGYKTLVRNLFGGLAADLGFDKADDESYQTSQLRPLALARAIKANSPDLVAAATERFNAGTLHPDLCSSVYRSLFAVADADSGAALKDKLISMYNDATSQDTRVIVLSAIGGAPTKDLASQVMEWAASSGDVRNQDLIYVVGSLSGSHHGCEAVWEYVKANFAELEVKFSGAFLLARLLKTTVGSMTTQAQLDDVDAFFEGKDRTAYDRPLKQACEEASARVAWLGRDGDAVGEWLQAL